jgi:hypothetical protein
MKPDLVVVLYPFSQTKAGILIAHIGTLPHFLTLLRFGENAPVSRCFADDKAV